jgi:predicted transcriptional regulator of viral defense system
MIVYEFVERMRPFGIFSIAEIESIYPGLDSRRLFEWQSKGYIIKIRNEWYCLPEFLKEPYSTWLIANLVHSPSYISLESSLAYYDLIPEGVFMTTSVTTGRPRTSVMAGHHYAYSSIRTNLFLGYTLVDTGINNRKVKMADMEKAIFDFFYFRTGYSTMSAIRELRFNDAVLQADLNIERLNDYLEMAKNDALEKRIRKLLKVYSNA